MFCKIFINFLLFINIFIYIFNNLKLLNASEISAAVQCHKNYISVEISLNSPYVSRQAVYWSNLYDNTRNDCQTFHYKNYIGLKVFADDFSKCGFGRILNRLQVNFTRKNIVIYYQDLVLEQGSGDIKRISVKCAYKVKKSSIKNKHKLMKRAELAEDFHEDDEIEILATIEQQAAEPQVLMEVRQNDQLIDGMVIVIPGTPLVMEVKLNEDSTTIYGLKVNYLEVSDTRDTSETILFRGCTVDPYLFENFNLTSNNSLTSKFRAFKFPNTSFVQFKANVEICLKRCPAPLCSIGNTDRLRRKREAVIMPEVQFEALIDLTMKISEFNGTNKDELMELENHVKKLKSNSLRLKSQLF